MSSPPDPSRKAKYRAGRFHGFWERVTEGRELHQLWREFKSEAEANYRLYSGDVDWDAIGSKSRGAGRIFRSAWALFQVMLMQLSPARRVLLIAAILLLL